MTAPAALPGELREDENFTTALYRAAIGPVSTDYYLTLFTAWEAAGRWRPHWNTAAGLWTLGWLVFRQMGGMALAYAGALVGSLLLLGIGKLVLAVPEVVQMMALGLWLAVLVLVPGLWGNRWFHQQCRQRMDLALAAHSDVAEACAALARQSSPRKRGLLIGGVQAGFLLVLGLAAWQFSALLHHPALPGVASNAMPPASPQSAQGTVKDMDPPAAAKAATTSAPVSAPALAPVTAPASAPTSAPASAPVAAPASAPASASTPAPASAPAPKAMPKPTPTPATAPKAPALPPSAAVTVSASRHQYGVNVGLFAKPENAQNVRVKLELASLPVISDTLNMPRGPRIRIRVGPYTTQAQADAAVTTIRALGLEAVAYRE